MRWLELAAGYDCNQRCDGCFSVSADPALQMSSRDALGWLQRGRREGARHVWFGGGEPTLRRDFLPLLKAARQLGYERIKVQSNGLLFAYPEFVARAVDAGMSETNLLLRSLEPERHDALVGRAGAHALLQQAIAGLRGKVRLEGDLLLESSTAGELPEFVSRAASEGFSRLSVWLFSSQGPATPDRVPSLDELRPLLLEASSRAEKNGLELVSLHTPYCAWPPGHWQRQFDPQAMQLYVVNPDHTAFYLHESSMERGVQVEACASCAAKSFCRGLRPDMLAAHGEGQVRPFGPEELGGREPCASTLEL